jgi:hypothetical protein
MFNKDSKTHTLGKEIVLGKLYNNMHNIETSPLSLILCETQLKMGQSWGKGMGG